MSKYGKLLLQVTSGKSDKDIETDDLCRLMIKLGFDNRIRGSHHIFFKAGINELINLQCDGKNAKPYQVKQVRRIIFEDELGGNL